MRLFSFDQDVDAYVTIFTFRTILILFVRSSASCVIMNVTLELELLAIASYSYI